MYRLVRNLYILAFIMIIVFVSGWFYNYHGTNRQLQETAQKSTELSVYLQSKKISRWLVKKTKTIENAASFIALEEWSDEQILSYLNALLEDNREFESIYFGTTENLMLNASGWEPPGDFDLRLRTWYKKALAEKQTIFTEAFINASEDRVIFTIATPVYSYTGKLLGVVAGDISVDRVIGLLIDADNQSYAAADSYSFLIDSKGYIIAHPELEYTPDAELVPFAEKYSPEDDDFVETIAAGSGVGQIEMTGKEGYLAHLEVPDTDWRLATFIPLVVFTEESDRITAEFIAALTASMLIALLFMLYHHFYVHKPLLRLESHLKRIDIEETLSYRLPVEKDSDLAVLGNTINTLLDKAQTYFNSLEESKRELKKSNRELEDMIRKLTTAEEALDYSEEKLYYLSYHDQLTGLYNRFYFEAKLKQLDDKSEYPLTVIAADINGLKLLNDTLGHDAGDRLLKNTADILNESLSHSGILARVGGDEFSAILPLTGKEESECLARQVRYRVAHYNQHNPDLPLSLSLGVATAEKQGKTLKKTFKEAEDLMFRDKLQHDNYARRDVVQSLMTALADRDFITQGHIQRVEKISLAMGEIINLDAGQLAKLALLAQVHDLGKVGIPDHILFKPGSLSKDEWTVMKQHSEKGYRIASSSSDLEGVADLILKHHEHWDGSGYPLGLKGEAIPVECRILNIADAYDSMTNNRPYQKAVSSDKAVDIIIKGAGKQFDPDLVRIFVTIIKDPKFKL